MKNEKIKADAFVVGDIHGCYDSFIELLNNAKINIDKHQIVSVGDAVDKGPDSLKVLEFFEKYGVLAVQGNHEDKFARYAKGNKIKVTEEVADTRKQLGENWVEWGLKMAEWPRYLAFEDAQGPGYVVHGGVSPDRPIEQQSSNYLLRLRTWPFEAYVRGVEAKSPPWQDAYKGHLGTILHGHMPLPDVHVNGNKLAYALDGGCVYWTDREWIGRIRGVQLGSRKIFEAYGCQKYMDHYNGLEANK